MKTSTKGLAALICSEGIVTSRYLDSVGVWTIGIGHTKAAGAPDPASFVAEMTVQRCLELFKADVAKYEKDVSAAIKVPLAQNEFDALVHWHYNTGAIKTATLTKTINSGNKAKGGQQIMNWLKPPEIKGRREVEKAMFFGTYPKKYMANVYPAVSGKVQWSKAKQVDVLKMLEGEPQPVEEPTPPPVPTQKPPVEEKPSLWASILNLFKRT